MSNKKSFFKQKKNRKAIFIALFVAMILFIAETAVWAIEQTINILFNVSEPINSFTSTLPHAIAVFIAFLFLLYFVKQYSEGIDI